jgi:hypothetical protein
LNVEIHIIHNAFPGKTFERKCKESGKGKQKFDIIFFNFVSFFPNFLGIINVSPIQEHPYQTRYGGAE